MKKIYLSLVFLAMTTLAMSQVGPSWWQFLPADFEDNVYERQTVMVQKTGDATVIGASSLEDLWNSVGTDFMYSITSQTVLAVDTLGGSDPVILPVQQPDDYTGSYTLIAGDDALYVLYKVLDDEVTAEDFAELHFAPYAGKFDPGREIYPEVKRVGAGYQWIGHWWEAEESYVWGFDIAGGGIPFGWSPVHKGVDYVEMAKYGSWTEVGAYKVELALESNSENFAPAVVYSLNGPDLDTLGDATNGQLPMAMQTVYEPTAGGYYFLAVVPWDLMPTGKMENIGDQISIATKVNDFDADNYTYTNGDGDVVTQRYDYWGGSTDNNVYWAIGYYGAVAELVSGPLANEEVQNEGIKAYYANEQLIIKNTNGNHTVNIYDINGKLMGQFKGDNQISVSFLNAGYYIANIYDEEGKRSAMKFVKSTY